MIRVLRAMFYLRLRLLAGALRPARRRDRLEHASRVFQALGPILLLVFLIPGLFTMGFIGFLGGWLLPQGEDSPAAILIILRLVLAFEIFLAVLAPLLRSAQGSIPNLTRLLLLPIPTRFLYLSEVLAGLADPWMALVSAGLLLFPVGMLIGAGFRPAAITLLAGLMILALLTGLGALCSTAARLIFRDRRRGEAAAFILLTLVALGGMLPAFLPPPGPRRSPAGLVGPPPGPESGSGPVPPRRGENRTEPMKPLAGWTLAYPPELYVRSVGLAAAGREGAGLLPLLPLFLQTGLVHAVAVRLHRRLLESPEVQTSSRGRRPPPRSLVLPGLGPAGSAVALNQFRLVSRTVQGKIAFCLIPLLVMVLGWIGTHLPEGERIGSPQFPPGVLLAFLGTLVSLLTLESSTLNQFAMDRAGLTLTFLTPLSDRDLLRGKSAGSGLLAASRALPCLAAAAVVAPGGSPFLWLSVPVAGAAAYFLFSAGGAILSAIFPKSMDLSRIGQAAKPHPLASLFGMLVLAGAALPAAGLALVTLLVFHRPALLLLLMIGWALAAGLLAKLLFRPAARLLDRRRENLLLVAQGC